MRIGWKNGYHLDEVEAVTEIMNTDLQDLSRMPGLVSNLWTEKGPEVEPVANPRPEFDYRKLTCLANSPGSLNRP